VNPIFTYIPEESYQPSIGEKEGTMPSMPIPVPRIDVTKQEGALKSKFCHEVLREEVPDTDHEVLWAMRGAADVE